jgi:hypothetical protein
MKIIISSFLLIFAFVSVSYSQFSIGAGPSMIKAFGVPSPFGGFHLLGEMPVDDQSSYYGKISFYRKQTGSNMQAYAEAIDLETVPNPLLVNLKQSYNYTTIEGGRRYYFGNGYDYGFAPYGGTHLMLIFNQSKMSSDFDKSKYKIPDFEERGNMFNLAFGLSGGIKNDFSFGTIYLDASFDFALISVPSNQTAVNGYQEFGSQLLFTFALGYKKTIF